MNEMCVGLPAHIRICVCVCSILGYVGVPQNRKPHYMRTVPLHTQGLCGSATASSIEEYSTKGEGRVRDGGREGGRERDAGTVRERNCQ